MSVEHHHPVEPLPRGPVDSDVDLRIDGRAQRVHDPVILGAIAVGGAIGAAARYLVGLGWPTPPGGFPVSTLIINVVGCGLIGILMVLVTDVLTRQRLLRPFLGTGVLGGFTTFSTCAVDIQQLVTGRNAGIALLYLATTVVGALLAVRATVSATRALITWRTR
ncbi:CrcB family protein [Kribbella sp. VKM Ac-2566]|uniref:fluoride efflux transporter FluC n=1 Tax=Kribbella sp. VKM Ac-2566 TaxID=2512218 RepID=UPI00192DA490|nr:CrcB family protein [Kribbella sp. VKM Ac-2566]